MVAGHDRAQQASLAMPAKRDGQKGAQCTSIPVSGAFVHHGEVVAFLRDHGDLPGQGASEAQVVELRDGPLQIAPVDEQINVTHRPQGDVPIDQRRQVGSFQDDHRDVVVLEGLKHRAEFPVEQRVPGAGHEIDFAQALQNVAGDVGRGGVIGKPLIEQRRNVVQGSQGQHLAPV